MAEELQKDPITRGDFITMGIGGTLVGAAILIPSTIFALDPSIKANFQGIRDVPQEWTEVG
ncbi:MAG: hypothetical protein M3272_00825, partial [Actinomycetota bacterium]|nr:hypothetical protein [Actinomycetota bacterium]